MLRSLPGLLATAVLLIGGLALAATPAQRTSPDNATRQQAQAGLPVDVALVIAVDISLSMDPGEQALQRDGYVEAFRHPDLLATIENGLFQRIAVTYVEWGSSVDQSVVLPWTVVEDEASAEAVAAQLAATDIRRSRSTSISAAIDLAVGLFALKEVEAVRRVIDVSGDGPNNDGRPVLDARADALALGITINGLPVMLRPMGFSPWSIPELDAYYSDCVIGGPASFVLPVRDPADFKDAIRQKLLLEIAAAPTGIQAASYTSAQADSGTSDCLIGERLRRQMWQD
jgi:hypothetical protein